MHYKLDEGPNYDRNVNINQHKMARQTLESKPVDTCGQAVDSSFASIKLNV